MRIILATVIAALGASACTYDESLGRTIPPLQPGHLEARWAVTLGGPCVAGEQVERASDGDVVVAGIAQDDTVNGMFVAKRRASDGAALWSIVIPDLTFERFGLDDEGHTIVVASVHAEPSTTALLALDAAGAIVWRHDLATWRNVDISGMSATAAGGFYLSGRFRNTIELTDGVVAVSAGESVNDTSGHSGDAFIARFDGVGELVWGRVFTAPGSQAIGALATTSSGEILATASTYGGAASFGGAAVQPVSDLPASVFLRFTSDGAYVAQQLLPAEPGAYVSLQAMVIDELDHPVIATSEWLASGDVNLKTWTSGYDSDELVVHASGQSFFANRPSIAPNGMIVGGTINPNPTQATIRVFDPSGSTLGDASYQMLGAPQVGEGFDITGFAATNDQIVATGALFYAVDFGTGTVWSHHAATHPDGTPLSGGRDALLVTFEWVTN